MSRPVNDDHEHIELDLFLDRRPLPAGLARKIAQIDPGEVVEAGQGDPSAGLVFLLERWVDTYRGPGWKVTEIRPNPFTSRDARYSVRLVRDTQQMAVKMAVSPEDATSA